jgi:hypothetical protein
LKCIEKQPFKPDLTARKAVQSLPSRAPAADGWWTGCTEHPMLLSAMALAICTSLDVHLEKLHWCESRLKQITAVQMCQITVGLKSVPAASKKLYRSIKNSLQWPGQALAVSHTLPR